MDLLCFANPTPFPFMWPMLCKCFFPCVDHLLRQRVFCSLASVLDFLLHPHLDGPSTLWRELQVLLNRIIILFPSIQAFVTHETFDLVGRRSRRVVEESGIRKLSRSAPPCTPKLPVILTCSVVGVWCGHLRACLPFRPEARFPAVARAVPKEARRAAY